VKVEWDRSLELFLEKAVGFVMWAILLIVVASNMGMDVTGFIAGLSIMGFVVGFATKDTLSNLVSGLFILGNKPFKVGDKVKVHKNVEGIVKEMGIATCILVTEEDEYITVPNSKIWGEAIYNYSRLHKAIADGRKIEEGQTQEAKEEEKKAT